MGRGGARHNHPLALVYVCTMFAHLHPIRRCPAAVAVATLATPEPPKLASRTSHVQCVMLWALCSVFWVINHLRGQVLVARPQWGSAGTTHAGEVTIVWHVSRSR